MNSQALLLQLVALVALFSLVGAANETAATTAETTELRMELARLRQEGKQLQAAELMEQWLQVHPRDERLYLELGQLYADQRDLDQAVETWQRLLRQVPGREDLIRTVSNRCRRAGTDEKALKILLEGRAQIDQAGVLDWDIAQLHMVGGHYEAGIQSMFEHLKAKPRHRPIVEGYLRSMVSNPNTAASTRLLQSLEQAARGSVAGEDKTTGLDAVSASHLAAAIAIEGGRPEMALALIEIIRDLPGAPTAILQLALLAEARGFQREALVTHTLLLERYPDAQPERALAQLKRGELLASLGQADLAETAFLSVAQGAGGERTQAQALFRAAQLQLDKNDLQAASATLTQLFDRYHSDSWLNPALAMRAECALRLDDLDAYALRLRELRERTPDDTSIRFDLAQLAYYRGDFPAAIGLLDSLLRADPGSDLANDSLQLLLLIETHQSEHAALSMLARAQLLERQRSKEAAAAWSWLSANASAELSERSLWLRAQLREREAPGEALGIYTQMLASFPGGRLVLRAHLGRARTLEKSGRAAEALKAYEMALLQFPADPTVPRIRLHVQRLRQTLRPIERDGEG